MRDNIYLENLLYDIWENHFSDIPRLNLVSIRYGKHAKRQLGSIKLIKDRKTFERYVKEHKTDKNIYDNPSVSLITVTRYFSYDHIPEYVVKSTIAHELCHYSHGFSSPLKKKYKYPHQGGIVKKELKKRELFDLYKDSKEWISKHWLEVIS